MREHLPPQVSVVVPAYNSGAFIDETLRSILAQRDVTLECIVIDDGSTDDTAARVQQHPDVTLVRTPNRGVSNARNLGIAEATAPLVALCDADDLWHPDKLRLQLDCLAARPEVDAVLSGWEMFGELSDGRVVLYDDADEGLRRWIAHAGPPPALPTTGLFRREVFDRLGGFDPAADQVEDLELAIRLVHGARIAYAPQVLARYRTHAGQAHRDLFGVVPRRRAVNASIPDARLRRTATARYEANMVLVSLHHRAFRRALGHAAASLRTGRPTVVGMVTGRAVAHATRSVRRRRRT